MLDVICYLSPWYPQVICLYIQSCWVTKQDFIQYSHSHTFLGHIMAAVAQKSGGQAPEMQLNPTYDHYEYPTTSPNVQSGHPGHTTKEQDAHVSQLRTQLAQAGYKERLDTLSMVC